jgi:outer membrane protein TolC
MRQNNRSQKLRGFLPLALLITALLAGNAAAESLQEAWDTALAVSHSLKASRENTAATASLLEAAKSARIPNITLEAGYSVLDNTPEMQADLLGQSLQLPVAPQNSAAFKTMATLPLYTGGRIGSGIDAASASLDAAKHGEIGDTQSLKLRVADAYVAVMRAGSLLKVAESHVQSLEAHAHDVENFYTQGMVAKSDLLSASVSLADARQKALQATNALDLARAAYNRLLARPLDQSVTLEEFTSENGGHPLSSLTEQAFSKRSELAALARQIEAIHHQASAVRGETLPQVALTGGYNYQQNRYQVHEGQWIVALGVKWNLFDGGVVANRASAVGRQASALVEQREELASIVALQVRQSWLDVNETRKRLIVTQSAIGQAEENLRVVRDRYSNGLSTHTEVLNAETLRINNESSHTNVLYDAALAGLRLKRAVGEL